MLRVMPGEGVGDIVLGASRASVLEKFGQPLQAEREVVSDTLFRDEWVVGEGVLSALFYEDRVIQLQVDGPAYTTPSGLTAQSTIQEIRAAYPDMEVSVMAHDMDNMYLDEIDQGIAFSIRGVRSEEPANKDGDVINVFVHPPGQEIIAVVHHHEAHH